MTWWGYSGNAIRGERAIKILPLGFAGAEATTRRNLNQPKSL
jgi:hypothetical protein